MARTQYTEDFEMFWELYPPRWDRQGHKLIKRKKAPAFESWRKLNNEIRAECLMVATQIKSSEGFSPRDCVTWINQKGWEEMRPKKKRPTNEQIQEMATGLLKTPPEPKPEPVYKQRKKLLADEVKRQS